MKRHAIILALLASCLIGGSACSKKSGGSSSGGGVPPQQQLVDPNGSWEGFTSQNRRITFTVSSDKVTRLEVGYRFEGRFCAGGGDATISGMSVAITDRKFSDVGPSYSFEGEFLADSAKGTFVLETRSCDATTSVTWSATKTAITTGASAFRDETFHISNEIDIDRMTNE